MDYKKKYREAQKWIESIYSELSHEQQMEAEAFFPELKESEDEKIRKLLISGMKNLNYSAETFASVPIKDVIDWLEKQGKKETLCDKCRKEHPSHSCQDITALGRCALEKQDEQKPSVVDFKAEDWYVSKVDGKIYNAKFMESSEKQGEQVEINPSEFDLRLNRLLKQFESLPKEELANSLSFYLNVVQNDGTYVEEKQGEQKPTKWSEEDEDAIGMAIIALEDMYDEDAPNTTYGGYNLPFNKAAERLKSLKDRVQPKQEWSKEDETKMRAALAFIKSEFPKKGNEEIMEDTIEWLKSLKQRIGWKPSAGQMKALHDLNLTGNISYAGQGQILIELYNDLKKLTE